MRAERSSSDRAAEIAFAGDGSRLAVAAASGLMPTIPLHIRPQHADAWHRVASPGGYEWWHFDAQDVTHDRRIVVTLHDGFGFHPAYLRADARYRRRPTRHPPPLPREFPCVHFAMYEAGSVLAQFTTRYSPSQFAASTENTAVRIGPNEVRPHDDGGLRITAGGAELVFRPRFARSPLRHAFLAGAEHHWIIANPLCDVEGTIHLPGQSPVAFCGRGYHDHHWGAAPLASALRRWLRGRALFDDAAYAFHITQADADAQARLVQADSAGTRGVSITRVDADWSRTTKWLLRYPRQLSLGNVLRLHNPRLLDSSLYSVRIVYDAAVQDRCGSALCDIAYPRRLRWPVFGRAIQMGIETPVHGR